jgi:5-methylcytosine-specific restriction endonuclease McrA
VSHALVLNTTFEPLGVVAARRAAVLILTEKAIPLELSERVLRSERAVLREPLVVRLTRFVRVPYRATVPLTRRAVFARDGGRCVYCDAPATSLDHVLPRSRGGGHTWDNVVSCCRRCNHAKADRVISELGWRMPRPPRAPTGISWRVLGSGRVAPQWTPYLTGSPVTEGAASA